MRFALALVPLLSGCSLVFDGTSYQGGTRDGGDLSDGNDDGHNDGMTLDRYVPRYWTSDKWSGLEAGTMDLRVPEGESWVLFTGSTGEGLASPYIFDKKLDADARWDTQRGGAQPSDLDLPYVTVDLAVEGDSLEVVVLLVRTLTIEREAALFAVGDRPLVIVATDRVALEPGGVGDGLGGRLDLGAWTSEGSGNKAGIPGAGATARPDAPGRGEDGAVFMSTEKRSLGGGGGGYASSGGTGGSGKDGTPAASMAGAAVDPPTGLFGGLSGGDTLPPDDIPNHRIFGGFGGGAIQILAGNEIIVGTTAEITAGGGGGRAPIDLGRAGGSGGGSGGLVVLEAPRVIVMGTVATHGGGGGQASRCDDTTCPTPFNGERGSSAGNATGGQRFITDLWFGGTGSDVAGVASGGSSVPDTDVGAGSGGGGGGGYIIVRTGEEADALEDAKLVPKVMSKDDVVITPIIEPDTSFD